LDNNSFEPKAVDFDCVIESNARPEEFERKASKDSNSMKQYGTK
jgi:hypothetical protein